MTAKDNKPKAAPVAMLLDKKMPAAHRVELLKSMANHESTESNELLAQYVEIAASGNLATYTQKTEELQEMIDEIKQGPKRMGTFVCLQQQTNSPIQHAIVRLENGVTAFPIILDAQLARQLKCGNNVILDSHAKGMISLASLQNGSGEEAHFERRIGADHIEVSVRGDEHHVYRMANDLVNSIEKGAVDPGNRILVCPHRQMAFSHLPDEDGFANFRFLDKSKLPDVVVKRDIAAPPAFIEEIAQMVYLEVTDPEKRRRYGLRRCVMKLLTGMPGTGKSFAICGLIREIYEVISRVIEVPLNDLPPRVMRLKASTVLSEWLGKSEKNIARFFSEMEQLSKQPFIASEGKSIKLPVIVVLEEIDGLARHRGEEPIMDRIFTTLLELFDPTRSQLSDNFIIFVGTTNKPHLIDSGFLRRIGGTVERFAMLNRNTFAEVLKKHLINKPLVLQEDLGHDEMLSKLVYELSSWLFSPNGEDRGQVSLAFVGSAEPAIRFRRDFMNPGLVDRAVQHAAQLACSAEVAGCDHPGITSVGLKAAIDEQIQAIINVLSADNVTSYLELPEGSRVQSIRAITQPAILPSNLMRAA
jgi:ATP-dependent 26S proteasome regulatory subunit